MLTSVKIFAIEHIRNVIYNILLYIEKMFTRYGIYRVMVFSIGLVHCLYAGVFFATNFTFMGLVNIGSIVWYSYAFYLAKCNKNKQAFMVTILEVYFHAVLASSFFGGGSLFILPLFGIYLLQFIAFKNISTNICILILSVVALIIAFTHGPSVELSNEVLYVFIVMNSIIVSIFISFFGIIFSFQGDNIEEIRKKYYIDWLTGLNNRKYVEEKMFKDIEKLQSCAICICDIDNFKKINDVYGHDVGDIVLKDVVGVMKQHTESFGCEIARWGGEEFMLKLNNSNKIITQNFFENMRKVVELKYIPEIHSSITITLGICYVKNPNIFSIQKYFKLADEMLYEGKNSGKNKVTIKEYKVEE